MDRNAFRSSVIQALRRLLRPIARLALSAGIPWREFSEHAKRAFVAVATDEYGMQGRPTNVSRVSLLTGMARKEVTRLRRLEAHHREPPGEARRTTDATRLLSAWHQDERYRDARERPRVLAVQGPEPSFEALHRECGCDIPRTTMLKELERAGAVRIENQQVHALTRYYMPSPMDTESVLRAGSVIEDLGNTVTYNLTHRPAGSGRFEGRASSEHVRPDAVEAFEAFLEVRAMAFLEDVDAWLSRHQAEPHEPGLRLGAGVYQIHDRLSQTRGA